MKLILIGIFILIGAVLLYGLFFHILDNSGIFKKAYSREQTAKQNILTLFRWIEEGSLNSEELNSSISIIKSQLQILKKECAAGRASCAGVYGYMDNNFFTAVKSKYEPVISNMQLLNNLYSQAVAGKTGPAEPRYPWLDVKNSLIDCLQNEVIICCVSEKEKSKTDLLKPEILVAADIDSVVGLVDGAFRGIFKRKFRLSGEYRLVHKGSTSRGTSLDNTDFDFDLLFKEQEDHNKFVKELNPLIENLYRKLRASGYVIISKSERQVLSKIMINIIIQDGNGVVFRIQLFVGKDFKIYFDHLNAQIRQIEALGGKWEDLSGQVILFKRLIRDVLHNYGEAYGGLGGPGCEQFIIQADSSMDYGRKITSIGSFDKTMRWIYRAGLDKDSSTVVPLDKAAGQSGIYLQDLKSTNLLTTCSPIFWNKLVNAAAKYVELNKIRMSEDEFASLGLIEEAR